MRLMPWRSSTLSSSRSVIVTPSRKLLSAASCSAASGRHRVDGALEVVADGDDVAGELGDGVLGRLLLLALGPLADVVHLGVGPQQPVLEVGGLGPQRGDDVVGVLERLLAAASRAGAAGAPLAAGAPGCASRSRSGSCGVLAMVRSSCPRFGPHAPAAQCSVKSAGRPGPLLVMPDIMQCGRKNQVSSAPDQLGRVVHHRNDARIVEPRRPDDARARRRSCAAGPRTGPRSATSPTARTACSPSR